MIGKWKGFLCVLAVFFLVGVLKERIFAETIGSVYDDAGLLSSSETEDLDKSIEQLKITTGWEIFAVTVSDTGGKSAMSYADDFFDSHTAEGEDGLVFLIDMDNREIYISTCGEAIRYLTDDRIARITDGAYRYAGDARYSACFTAMLEGTERYYNAGIPQNQYNYDTETGEKSYYHALTQAEIFGTFLIGAIAAAAVFFSISGKYRLKYNTYNYDFHRYGRVHLTNSEDRFINQTTTHHRIKNQSVGSRSNRSGSRSSTHTSSSGRSHGGGGHKF